MDFRKIAETNRILEVKIGSHLYGTATPKSDLDLAGIFMPVEEMVYGFQICEEVDLGTADKDSTGRNTTDAVDRVLHEYRKFVKLALQNNPNILEILFVNEGNIIFANEFGRRLLDKAELFPHKGAYHRFIKYADSQRHKMRIRPENYAKLEEGLEILQKESDDKVLAELKDTLPFVYEGKGKHIKLGDLNFETSVFVKRARKLVRDRLSKATNRVQLFTKYGFDIKHACNLIRLLLEGVELMSTGKIVMPLAYCDEILKVKNGVYSAEQVLKRADELVEEARSAYEKSFLPVAPRSDEIERFLIEEIKSRLSHQKDSATDGGRIWRSTDCT